MPSELNDINWGGDLEEATRERYDLSSRSPVHLNFQATLLAGTVPIPIDLDITLHRNYKIGHLAVAFAEQWNAHLETHHEEVSSQYLAVALRDWTLFPEGRIFGVDSRMLGGQSLRDNGSILRSPQNFPKLMAYLTRY